MDDFPIDLVRRIHERARDLMLRSELGQQKVEPLQALAYIALVAVEGLCAIALDEHEKKKVR